MKSIVDMKELTFKNNKKKITIIFSYRKIQLIVIIKASVITYFRIRTCFKTLKCNTNWSFHTSIK